MTSSSVAAGQTELRGDAWAGVAKWTFVRKCTPKSEFRTTAKQIAKALKLLVSLDRHIVRRIAVAKHSLNAKYITS
jgi:hypothetical protein